MQFSLYKAGMHRAEATMAQLVGVTQTEEEIDLINMAVRFGKPTLIPNEDGDEIIVKPREDNDESLTFEGLFDMALSRVDLKRLKDSGGETIDLPLIKFEVRFSLYHEPIPVRALIQARSNNEVYGKLRTLLQTDVEFIKALGLHFLMQIEQSPDLGIGKPEIHRYSTIEPDEIGKAWELKSSETADKR